MAGTPFDLNQIRIASPCTASWDAMDGDARVRFCGQCSKHVYNLSAMSQSEAEQVIAEKEGHLCVRFYQRSDGTMLTRDCPVGLRAWRRKMAGWLAATAAAVATFVTIGGVFARGNSGNGPMQTFSNWVEPTPVSQGAVMMGEMCPPTPVVNPTPQKCVPPAPADAAVQVPLRETRKPE